MELIVALYFAYIIIAIGLTVWIARVLFKNGKVFLIDIFNGEEELSNSVNKLLITGFYLINFGYTVFALKTTSYVGSYQDLIEILSVKLGLIILVLGFMHFFNLMLFFRLRRRSRINKENKLVNAQAKAQHEANVLAWNQQQEQINPKPLR